MDQTLLRCLRWDREGDERLASLSSAEWAQLTAVLSRQSGLLFLARRLQRSSLVPPHATGELLRKATMACAARNLIRRTALGRMIDDVDRPALLLKGIDLADRLYGNMGHRRMRDVDFAAVPGDIARYDTYLRNEGFVGDLHPTPAVMGDDYHHHATYYRAADGLSFELHWCFRDRGFYALEEVIDRALPVPALARQALVMAPDDLFLFLCKHMADHVFDVSLVQLWDIAELIECPAATVDWPAVLGAAERLRLTNAVRIALHLVSESLGVPTGHISDWRPDPGLARVLPDVLQNLGQFPDLDGVVGYRISVVLGEQSSWRERMRALREAAFPARDVIRGTFGSPGDGFWRDCRSYLLRWRELYRRKGAVIFSWLKGGSGVVSHLNRAAALRKYLEEG